MARFVPLIIALCMLGVFSFALITGGVMFQVQNNVSVTLTNDSATNAFYQSINTSLSDYSNDANAANTAFSNSSITTTGVTPFINAIGGIWKILKASPVIIYNVVIGLIFGKLLGSAAALVVTSVLAGILILILISAVIYFVSRGEGG